MSFRKTASVTTLAVATSDGNGFTRTAQYNGEDNSAYLNGIKNIDIKAALDIVASEYDISPNPEDYIFEAIRGNTTNVPNDNSDGFHKHELLRFDHRLGKQVYRTYEYKPHQINHRAENPKNARGFIVDAHYNDSSSVLDFCPHCAEDGIETKTAELDNRDADTGIHCIKCGGVVKDEFVELLIAIDTKKDPTFANGVRNGVLKHGSMGCSCLRTRCNICQKVAYTRSDFCPHIAKGKGKEYDESTPGFNPTAYFIKQPKDKTAGKPKKVAKSFEWCEGVIFDEFSRVHDPADIKVETNEILTLQAKVAELQGDNKLHNESEILMLQTKVSELERRLEEKIVNLQKVANKEAQAMPPRLPTPAVGAPPGPLGPPGLPGPPDDEVPGMEGMPPLPGAEGLEQGLEQGLDTNIEINVGPEGAEIESNEPIEEIPSPAIPIEEMSPEEAGATPAGPGGALSPADMGLLPSPPPPRRGFKDNSGDKPMLRFAESYKNLKAEITKVGNIRIHDGEGTLFVIKPNRISEEFNKLASEGKSVEGAALAKSVLSMIAEQGIGNVIKHTNAIVGPRLAQVLDYYIDDMKDEERDQTDSVIQDQDTDTQEKRSRDKMTETATGLGESSDREDAHDTKSWENVDVLTDRETDVEDEQHDRSPNDLSVTEMHDSDKRDDRKDWDLGQSAVDDVSLDHKEKAASTKTAGDKCEECQCSPCECDKTAAIHQAKKHAARIEQIYKARYEKKVADLETKKEQFDKSLQDRLVRAMKIVARRQALNLEYSPMKTAFGIALCNPCELEDGYEYRPMDQKTALTLVEAAFGAPLIEDVDIPAWESFIDGLVHRASSIMDMNDESLMQIEADLKNMHVAAVTVTDDSISPNADINLRQAASNGNLQLVSNGSDSTPVIRGDKRQAIRQAVGTTKVAGLNNR